MQISEVQFEGAVPITGYGPNFFRVGEEVIEGAALVAPGHAAPWGGPVDLDAILALADQIDVLLMGTGAEIAHAPAQMRDTLEAAGIGVEVMASPAACRTYNILLGEGRRVAAALLPVG